MKRLLLIALGFIPTTLFAQSNCFIIHGNVGQEGPPAKAYLIYRSAGKVVRDSAMLNKGVFQLKGVLIDPAKAQLILDHTGVGLMNLGMNADVITLYLEKADINISSKDSVKNARISGSKLNDDNARYKELTAAPDKAKALTLAEFNGGSDWQRSDSAFKGTRLARYNQAEVEKETLQKLFIQQNPDSYLSLLTLTDIAGDDMDIPVIEPLFKGLSLNVRNTVRGIVFAKAIDAARTTSVGTMAPVFTENDVNDKPVSLADFKGKYVLLDFWASWCGPCRAENPNIVKAYNRFKGKNFTVLGVSLDRPGRKDDWLAAIKSDGLEWTQVSDLKFWDSDVAKLYGIKAIPQNYLIDPTGKIIDKDLSGDDLIAKLALLLN